MVTRGVLLQQDGAGRANFAAPIYGGPLGLMPVIPAKWSPILMQDDPLALEFAQKFYAALRTAGNQPKAHIYSTGLHGFGVKKQDPSSDQ